MRCGGGVASNYGWNSKNNKQNTLRLKCNNESNKNENVTHKIIKWIVDNFKKKKKKVLKTDTSTEDVRCRYGHLHTWIWKRKFHAYVNM